MKLSKKVKKLIQKTARQHVTIALQVTSYLPLASSEVEHINHKIRADSENLTRLITQDMVRDVAHNLEFEIEKSRIVQSNNGVKKEIT